MADDEQSLEAVAGRAAQVARAAGPGVRRVRVEDAGRVVEIEWFERDGTGGTGGTGGAGGATATSAGDIDPATAGLVPVEAPVVGTFYRSPQPGAPPFVEEGDTVEEGQAVAIVEAMKIMNQIAAPVAGRVAKIAVADGEIVEFAQPLLWLDPS